MGAPREPISSIADLDGVSIVPGVSILGVLSNLNYEPWFALAEYVDNAIQSARKSYVSLLREDADFQLQVDISYEREDGGRIIIDDNAGGIARRDFARAFKAAEVPPDRTGLSEFGMGMKSASIWFAQNWKVTTTSIGDPNIYGIEFDMESVLRNNVERLDVTSTPGDKSQHFTRIELRNLNQSLHGRTLGKVRDHLREIYRGFLRDNRLILTVAGLKMEYSPPDVLAAPDYRAGDAEGVSIHPITWRKDLEFNLVDGLKVRGWAAIRAEGKTSGNGISLFRRGRVIVGTSETPFRPARVYGQGNSYRSQRLFGELELDGLPVSHTKDGFQWHGLEEEFEERLREVLDAEPMPLLKQAEYYRARGANRAEQRRIREAADNTAEATRTGIPATLPDAVARTVVREPAPIPTDDPTGDASHQVNFAFEGRSWSVLITVASRPAESRWLIRNIDVDSTHSTVTANLLLNTAHPFLRQFALGSTDALEAVLRMAVAMVVSESLSRSAGDGESAAQFMRQVDVLLGSALSKRVGGTT